MKKLKAILLVGFLLLGACGGTPETNPFLEKVETTYREAEQDSLIVTKAPVALKEAEEALERSQNLLQKGEEKEVVEHYAYIAQQKVAIARETAELNVAQDEVERAESQRQQVLIQARKAEAVQAEQRAREALAQAEKVKQEAEKARFRAQELARQIDELEAQRTERGIVLTLGDVLFDFDKATLKPGGKRASEKLSRFLQEYPGRNVLIEGYTDNIGTDAYNQNLSLRRADAVRNALTDWGVASHRIEIKGYGEQYPVASNNSEAGRQQNRRVEVVISDPQGKIVERGE